MKSDLPSYLSFLHGSKRQQHRTTRAEARSLRLVSELWHSAHLFKDSNISMNFLSRRLNDYTFELNGSVTSPTRKQGVE